MKNYKVLKPEHWTVKQALSLLPEEYRDKAIANAWPHRVNEPACNALLSHVLREAFEWSASPEGADYWVHLYNVLHYSLEGDGPILPAWRFNGRTPNVSWVKGQAKKLKRAAGITHTQALDEIAKDQGFANYKALLNYVEAKGGARD